MKKVFNVFLALCIGMILSGFLTTASAFTVYTSETDFVSALDAYYLEDFAAYAGKYEGGPNSQDMGPVNGFGFTVSVTEENDYLYYMDAFLSTCEAAGPIRFDFSGDNVTAFGGIFWPTDINGENMTEGINIEIDLENGTSQTYSMDDADFNTFIGFTTTDTFASITFSGNGQTVWADKDAYMSVDHIYTGSASAVPVPGAIWLLGSGLLGLVGISRKKSY